MSFQNVIKRASEIRTKYSKLEKKEQGKEWTREQLVQGFVGDVGDLVKLTMVKNGVRDIPELDKKLKHELADCLWSLIVISEKYGVDLEEAFYETMDELEQKLDSK